MERTEVSKELRQIYRKIDDRTRQCERCGWCCKAGIRMTYIEFAYISERLDKVYLQNNGKCLFLNCDTKSCTVYDRRPWICRIYGKPNNTDRVIAIDKNFQLRKLKHGECCAITDKHNLRIAKRIARLNKKVAPRELKNGDRDLEEWIKLFLERKEIK